MSILYDEKDQTITIHTRHTTYQMQIDELGHLRHLYYGRRVDGSLTRLGAPDMFSFSPSPAEKRLDPGYSLDLMPQEYSGCNTGDFRLSSLEATAENGACAADFRYVSHEILPGKYQIEGMPSAFGDDEEAETLAVTLGDRAIGLEVILYYGVFYERDVITRAACIRNVGDQKLTLEKAASVCLDFPYGDWDLIHFPGRHEKEREPERARVGSDIQTISSKRGASSHQHNPFVILSDHAANEQWGDCCGLMLMYSGSHRTDIEKDQSGNVRIVSGIQDDLFSWQLDPGGSFWTPEALLSFTHEGLEKLSHNYHRFIRHNVCRSKWTLRRRPVLLNSWEASYFNFDTEKLLAIARQAKELGVELFVLDDGWFGARNDEHAGLGDWYVNERKLPGGLSRLIEEINAMGMKFGLWVEPEMVNEDSDLFRAHPDWVLAIPGRKSSYGRDQLVLDMSRADVVDYLWERLSDLLSHNKIDYLKWDMNRHMTEVYSRLLPSERQGEVFHRYILGVYALLERLTTNFPDLLLESCSGGGGRFDAAMLAYSPQIWCSDDTDAIERIGIQYGTSFGYPISAVGAHVSASPNHQTGRQVPLETRAVVAMSGTFGYELDPTKLDEKEKEQIRGQIRRFGSYYELIEDGDYYRLTDPAKNHWYAAWQSVSEDRKESLISLVMLCVRGNSPLICLRARGLDPDAHYRIEAFDCFVGQGPMEHLVKNRRDAVLGKTFTGAELMYAGLVMPRLFGDYPSLQIHLTQTK